MITAYCYEDSLIINNLEAKIARLEEGYNQCRATLKSVVANRDAEIEQLKLDYELLSNDYRQLLGDIARLRQLVNDND